MTKKVQHGKYPKRPGRVKTPWLKKHVEIVRRYCARSIKITDREKLRILRSELIVALSHAGKKNVSVAMLSAIATRYSYNWGMGTDVRRDSDTQIIKKQLERSAEFPTAIEFRKSLMTLLPRFASEVTIKNRISDLGIQMPVFSRGQKEQVGALAKESRTLLSLADISGLRAHLINRIQSGALVSKGGMSSLYVETGNDFSDVVRKAGFTLTYPQFEKLVEELVWSRATQDALIDYLRHAGDRDAAIAKWQQSYRHIPLDWVKEQSKWVLGVSSAVTAPIAMIPGLGGHLEDGWLDNIVDIEVPDTSFHEPYKVVLPDGSPCSWLVLNGSNLGLVYNRVIEENPLRRKLAEAEHGGVDVVFLTNVFALEIIKAGGPLMVYRARLSGLNTNVDLLDADYQEEARRILRDKPDDEVVFESPMERVMNLLSGFHKVITKPDGTSEFKGKIYLVLGWREEQLFATLAYWVLNYLRILKQAELKGEINLASRDMAEAKKFDDFEAYTEAHERLKRLTRQHARTITSSVTPSESNRFAPKIRSIVLSRLRELAPNVEVIGQGTTYVQINDKPVLTLHIPGHVRVSDTLLSEYAAKSGPKVIRQSIAKTTVICHPYALQARDTVREADHGGKRDSVQIFVAPILVDGEFLRKELGDVVRSTHPIQRAIFHDQFLPGALKFSYHAPGNIVSQDFWPLTLPTKIIHLKRKTSETKDVVYPDFGSAPYIWYAIATDPHLGARDREIIWCAERGENLGMFEATLHSMRKSGYLGSDKFGIHMWSCNDDPTQGHNFPTEQQPDPHQIPNMQFERMSREFGVRIAKADHSGRIRIFEEYQKFVLEQVSKRGIDWVQMQMEDLFDRFITPNTDFFSAVLSRAKRSGLIVKPVSEHYGIPYDQRDLGIINWGSGNHFDHSVEGMLTEGFLYSRDTKGKLLQRDEWKNDGAYIERHVRAPLYSNFFCAWGTVKIANGYEWGMDLRPSPTRMGGWGDTLLGAVRNDVLRGNPTRMMEGRMRIQTYGDKHFFGTAITPDVIFHMCAAGVHTNRYGEHGFPPNNSGVSFIGIPVEGPRVPLLFRYLRSEQIAQLAAPGVRFDWSAFLPNPI